MTPRANKFWLILFAAFLLLFCGCSTSQNTGTFKRDKWSESCPDKMYRVNDPADGLVCKSLKACSADSECKYLELNNMPPRFGKCVNDLCKAYCGNGTEWEC
jgi:hypothetical protein